tara:strand:- start:4309 stop:6792 length:2484 start_codon:yes stop_codon:yes gene_type:complete
MANDIDKGLYTAPQGLEDLADQIDDMEDVEIDVLDEDEFGDDDIIIDLDPSETAGDDDFDDNLAELVDEKVLVELSSDLVSDYESDVSSRKDWIDTYVEGIELLGLKVEERSEPWPGACAIYHPIMAEALVKFQAETMMETFPAAGPVKTKIIGKETPEKEGAALRVKEDMNYQLTEKMPEYRPEHERMLWGLGLSGNAFKKVYYDPTLERQVAIYVPAEDMVVPYGASDLNSAPRVTHVMRKTENELRKMQVAGFYRDIDLGEPNQTIDEVEKKIAERMGFNATTDNRYKLLEMHVDIDLEGYEDMDEDDKPTGIALPYVVTMECGTGEILSIRRNWHSDDKTKQKRQHFVHYPYIPGFGFYAFGMIHLIGAAAKSGTMLLRQLVDSGTLANLPGGFKTRGLRIKGDDTPIAPSEFRDVDVPSGSIRDNIMPLPYKEPSQVLQNLMNQIIAEGKSFANAADLKVSDMSANSPVGTTLAILERTLKVMSAVQARVHNAMKQEFKLISGIIRDYTPDDYSYDPQEGEARAKRGDYDMVEVIPVSDPNAATMSQKVVQYQAVMQMAQQDPQIYDKVELHKQMLEVLGIKNIAKLIPGAEDQKPKDPVTENVDILKGKPVKAFLYQDHKAHITVHQAAMQDPQLLQALSQNPQAQSIMASAMAHVTEHIAYMYRDQVEEQLGVDLPDPEQGMPKDVELELSRLTAKAAEQLLAKHTNEAQQEQAKQQAEDPIVQMQKQELEIKHGELQNKMKKTEADIALEKEKLALEKEKLASTERIAGARIGSDATKNDKNNEVKQVIEGAKLGMAAMNKQQQPQQQQQPNNSLKGKE